MTCVVLTEVQAPVELHANALDKVCTFVLKLTLLTLQPCHSAPVFLLMRNENVFTQRCVHKCSPQLYARQSQTGNNFINQQQENEGFFFKKWHIQTTEPHSAMNTNGLLPNKLIKKWAKQ